MGYTQNIHLMKPQEKNPVHSPYVVVLGGNSVRRKAPPPLDVRPDPSNHSMPLPDKLDARVYGVLPPLKTMAQDLKVVPKTEKTEKKKWWKFGRGKQVHDEVKEITHEVISPPESHITPAPKKVIEVPTQMERIVATPYRSHFMRGIAKKSYLASKLAVQLPIHAKIGAMIALLVLVVGAPLASRLVTTPTPITAGTVVALGTDALVAQVSKSIELPTGETPLVVIATADDIRRLNVPDAKPGNRILLYQQAGKIVVYDAEGDKVLGVVNRSQP